MAIEKRDPNLCFERPNAIGHIRLNGIELLRSPRDPAKPCNGGKGGEVGKLHRPFSNTDCSDLKKSFLQKSYRGVHCLSTGISEERS
jgi:hypothetical protein